MNRTVSAVMALVSALAAMPAWADAPFPAKPVTLVVPFPPGGAIDQIGRIVGKGMSERLQQAVVVDNKPGAGTELGATAVARAPADGYTLLISTNSTFTVNPALKPRLQYAPDTSFEGIALLGSSPLALLAPPGFPASNVRELVAVAKAKPGTLSYASFGTGTSAHLAGEMLKATAGIDLLHVPYKGSAASMTDLLGGRVDLSIDSIASALPMLRAGKIKVLATTGADRSVMLADVPTIAEAGYPDYEMTPWLAIVGPRGLPAPVKSRLASALSQTLADPTIRKQLEEVGLEVNYQGSGAYDARLAQELPKLRTFVQHAGITLD